MNNLKWLNKDNWCRGYHAIDSEGNIIDPRSVNAERFDLYSAITISFKDFEDAYKLMGKIKNAYASLYPKKFRECLPTVKQKVVLDALGNEVLNSMGKPKTEIEVGLPTMHELNDQLDNFEQVKRLLSMI